MDIKYESMLNGLLKYWSDVMFEARYPETKEKVFRDEHDFSFSVRVFVGDDCPICMRHNSLSCSFSFGKPGKKGGVEADTGWGMNRDYKEFIELACDSSIAKIIELLEKSYKTGTVIIKGKRPAGKDWKITISHKDIYEY